MQQKGGLAPVKNCQYVALPCRIPVLEHQKDTQSMALPQPQKFTPPEPGEKVQDWREIWTSDEDYMAQGYDPSRHSITAAEVSWVRSPDQLRKPEQ
jgi:hypothetical protein